MKVYDRLEKAPVLIIEGNGSNDLVDQKRGKKQRTLDMSSVEDLMNDDVPSEQSQPQYFDVIDEDFSDHEDQQV